jgi:hypothetical protein
VDDGTTAAALVAIADDFSAQADQMDPSLESTSLESTSLESTSLESTNLESSHRPPSGGGTSGGRAADDTV